MPQNYSDKLKDHYHNPRNTGKISDYNHTTEQINPLCGDEIRVFLKIRKLKIENLSYEVRGCMICVASASVVSEYAKGKTLPEIKKISLGGIEKMLKVSISPARANCATLFVETIRKHTS